MIVLEVCVVVVLVGLTAAAVLGRLGGGWTDPVSSHRHGALPEDDLTRDDLLGLRFDQGLRGYRMDQVDAVLRRLTDELGERDRRIAALRRDLSGDRARHDPADRAEGAPAEAGPAEGEQDRSH